MNYKDKLTEAEELVKGLKILVDEYKEDPEWDLFNILHIYPGKPAVTRGGYHDARLFRVVGFDTLQGVTRDFGKNHDALQNIAFGKPWPLKAIQVWTDGAVTLYFTCRVRVYGDLQVVNFEVVE